MSPHCLPDPLRRTGASGSWLLVSAAAAVALFAAGLMLYQPFWESNDDAGMSMIAHGYGLATAPSPLLLFQNVLVGYVLQLLPKIDGVLPYSWLTMALMLVSGSALVYFVVRSGGAFWLAVIALAIVYARIVAAPQFTITAGFATAAGVLAWFSHARSPSLGALVAGAVLVVIGYLVRPEEAVFVLMVALPFVRWKQLPRTRPEIITAALTVAFVAFATLFDHSQYAGPEWAAFRAIDPLRVLLTDYDIDQHILNHPGLMQAHGFTKNDIQLIASWFYFDPAVADPARLKALIASLPVENRLFENALGAERAVSALADPTIAPLMIAALTVTVLSRCLRRAIVAWAVFLAIIIAFGFAGRPAVLHTYFPIPILILFAGLACGLREKMHRPMLRVVPWTVLLAALAMMLRVNIGENQALIARSLVAREDVAKLDRTRTYVVWGAALPTELVLPVFESNTKELDFPQYGLGWESLTPFALATFKGAPWKDLADRIARDHDIPFLAARGRMALLSTYCREHLNRELNVHEEPLTTFTVFYVTCAKS